MVPCLAVLVLLVGVGQAGRANAEMTFAHLILNSSPGSFIGGGQNWDITYTPANTTNGFFNANILTSDNVNGQPAVLHFSFLQLGMNPDNYATLDFSTLSLPKMPFWHLNSWSGCAEPSAPKARRTLTGLQVPEWHFR
jgi:hypothetical protein